MQSRILPVAQPTSISNNRPNLIKRYPVASGLVLFFALAFSIMIPTALASQGLLPFAIPEYATLLAGWAPAISAIVVTAIVSGKRGIKTLLGRYLIWTNNPLWYLLGIFGIALVMLGGTALYTAAGNSMPMIPIWGVPLSQAAYLLVVTMGLSILLNTEELFWRGFMLPRLQARHTALIASVIIAVPEFALHLPYFFDANGSFFQSVGMPVFFLFTLSEVILLSWMFNSTRGSLIIVTLLHASQNTWSNLLTDSQAAPFYYMVALLVTAAVVVIIKYGPEQLAATKRIIVSDETAPNN